MAKKEVAPLEVFEGRAVVITKDGTAKSQVQSVSIDDALSAKKYAQSGDEKKYTYYGAKDVSGTMEMFAGDIIGFAGLLGYSGDLAGVEIHLKANQIEFYITKEFYDKNNDVAFTEVVRGVTVEKISSGHGAEDADKVTISINAKEHLYVVGVYTPSGY